MKLLNKVKFILLIVFVMTLIFATKSFAVTGVITEITVNLRKEANSSSTILKQLSRNKQVTVIEKVNKFKNKRIF